MEGTGSVDAAVAVLQQSGSLLGGLRNTSKQEMSCTNALQPTSSMSEVEFMMYRFKTQPCPKPYTHDWAPCPYYHKHASEKARRRSPLTHTYSAVLCPDMEQHGTCPKGDSCGMSHNVFEYGLHPDRYRTKLCTMGPACTRPICFYAHSHKQLRMACGYGPITAQTNQPRQHKPISDAMPASASDRSAPAAGPAAASDGAAGADGVGGSDGHRGAGYTAAVADGMSSADAGSVPADMADAQRSSKPEGLQVLRVTADQGSSMLAAQHGGISCTKDSTAFGMSWFGSSPLAPATPNAAALDMLACQPPPPPPPPHGQQQQQQQVVLSVPPVQQKEQQVQQEQQDPALVHCKPEPADFRTAPLAVAHQEGFSGQQEHQMQYQPDTPLAPWGTEITVAPAQSDDNLAQMQAQFAGLAVSAATAALYAAPSSVAGSAGAGAGLESQPGTATAASAAGAASLSWQVTGLAACGQQQYATSSGSSTPGVWSIAGAKAGGGHGVHAMLGTQQPQQQVVYNQQPQQQQQQQQLQQRLVYLNLDVSALQQLQHIKQQLQQRKLQQLQQQGMAGASVYGSLSAGGIAQPAAVQPTGEFPPGILFQQVADAGLDASAGAGSSLQPVMLQQPGHHVCLQQQQSQQQVLLVPAQMGAKAVGMQVMGAPAASMQAMGGVSQGVGMPYNDFGIMMQDGIGNGMFGY